MSSLDGHMETRVTGVSVTTDRVRWSGPLQGAAGTTVTEAYTLRVATPKDGYSRRLPSNGPVS